MMDQVLFENSVKKMKHRMEEGDLKKAVYIADKIDWSEVKDVNLLLYVSMIYEDYKDYDSAKALIEYAYEVAPIKSKLYFALCNIHIKLGDLKRAKDFYLNFCEVFPNDDKKILLKYYFLKKKGAEATQRCRVLEEYIEEEKSEDILFELATIYEEMGEKEKVVKTCEYIVEFFGVKKKGCGRKALELKKKYAPLTEKEQNLLINYVKENAEDERTNIVYQNIKRPNLKVIKENDDNYIKIEKINREKKEENIDEDNDEMRPAIKYEPEMMEELRDKELTMAFMKKGEKKVIEEQITGGGFDKYREKSFKRKDKNMRIEDLKQNMIIEAYSKQEAFDIATEELFYLHKTLGNEKKAAKSSAYNVNERGFSYYLEKLGDRDLIIESAGQLTNQVIDEIEEFIINNNKQNIIVLCDIINNFDKISENRPSFIDRFDVYSVLSEKKQDLVEDDSDIKKNFGDVETKKIDIATPNDSEEDKKTEEVSKQDVAAETDESNKNEDIKNNEKKEEIKNDVKENVEKNKIQDMNVDEFVEYCKKYAKSIDCNMPGKTVLALYERIEMMTEEGLALTEKRAIEMIEQAADKAEKPKLFFKPKYDKEGNLILQEEHFLD